MFLKRKRNNPHPSPKRIWYTEALRRETARFSTAMTTNNPDTSTQTSAAKTPSVFSLLGQYRGTIALLVVLATIANVLSLFLPRLISGIIDSFMQGALDLKTLSIQFGAFAMSIFVFTYLQSIVQTYASERVARDLRLKLVNKISRQSYRFIEDRNPSKLLTNITLHSLHHHALHSLQSLYS